MYFDIFIVVNTLFKYVSMTSTQMALSERESLLQQNYQLQHKLAEYFRKKKNDERQEYDKNVADQEQRYLKYMGTLKLYFALMPFLFASIFTHLFLIPIRCCLGVFHHWSQES
jgi:hypothetical protein